MRHNKNFNHLGRKKAHRDALLANMTISLIMHKRIFTTLAKAKALRMYAEPLINRAKEDSMNNRRLVFAYLQNKEAVTELFREISTKIAERNGGYTRILKTGNRLGDNAKMCMIELVDYNENLLKEKEAKKKQKIIEVKEVRLSPNIDTNDLNTKISAARKFIEKGNKVKITLRFRGREMAHIQNGRRILDAFAEKMSDIAVVEKAPKMEGRQMLMFLTEKRQ